MNQLSDVQLIELQIATLFVCDPNGRLQFIREPGYAAWERDPAPRFWMGRTRAGNIWRFRHNLPTIWYSRSITSAISSQWPKISPSHQPLPPRFAPS